MTKPREPWDEEPERKHWVDEATGLDCLIVRNSWIGTLCGYVGVPQDHPWYGVGYNDIDVDVHGGLTFAAACGGRVCHHAGEDAVANGNVWWLGFDCAHAGDYIPRVASRMGSGGVYRDMAYVTGQCADLARQCKAARPPMPELDL